MDFYKIITKFLQDHDTFGIQKAYLRIEIYPRRKTMQKKSALLVVLGILITAAVLGAFSQTGEDLFQKALRLERNEGKLMEAIELYETILKQFPENREVAAKAQFH
ncbi:hypothetical protein KA005_72550, partial [bacterium]|nr:hypothetical protein [bacterium]